MKLIAHRGKIHKSEIGNNRKSIFNALSKSYIDGIELDVRLTKDDKVVVIHDPIIDFVSNGTGIISYMTLEELKQYDFSNEFILTLEELLNTIHTRKLILIELKDENKRIVEEVNRIIIKHPELEIVVISFWESLLQEMKKINSKTKLGILIGYFLNQKNIYNHYDYYFFTFHYVEQIHRHKNVGYFTINQKKQLETLTALRDDIYIITDSASNF